jgi:hypothetical protein
LVLSSCKKEEPKRSVYDVGTFLTVQDKVGKDLLNPANSGAYLEQDIKIFYVTNGIKKEVYYPNSDYPRGFIIIEEPDKKFWMEVDLNAALSETYPITYIQWSEIDTDTLKTEIFRKDGLVTCKDIWINDSLVWKWIDYEKGERNIEIIK